METLDQMLKPEENQAQAEAYTQPEDNPNMAGTAEIAEAEAIDEPCNPEAGFIKETEAIHSLEPPKPYGQEGINERADEQKRRARLMIIGFSFIVLAMLAVISIRYLGQEGLTGYAVSMREVPETETYDAVFEESTEIPLELEDITSLRISGALEGTRAVVKLRINDIELLVADITMPEPGITSPASGEEPTAYTITTDKAEYAVGETVTISIIPDAEDKSLYVSYGENTQKLDEGINTYVPAFAGEYQAIALVVEEEDILRISANFTVTEAIDEELSEPSTEEAALNEPAPEEELTTGQESETIPTETQIAYEFKELCADTCDLGGATNPTLIIEVEPGSKLTITEITITRMKENSAPEQAKPVPDITLSTGQTTTLSLDEYFTDPEGDLIQYDMNEIAEISASLAQSELSISSDTIGVYTAYIYATDGDKLVTSNTFTITVTQAEAQMPIEENQTTNETTNESNADITTGPCANPDINLRPSICFVGVEEKAFEELSVDIQDKGRGSVGRFTRFGNLIIRGLVIENTAGAPQEKDFSLGYTQRNGFDETRISTAWISTETGNLHLAGKIHENQEELNPYQFNTFVVRNKFGMILGYFDELTGDLYLRGNIVQLGKI